LNINWDCTSACVYVPIHPGASKEHEYYTTQVVYYKRYRSDLSCTQV